MTLNNERLTEQILLFIIVNVTIYMALLFSSDDFLPVPVIITSFKMTSAVNILKQFQ
jgi:hypothetical protein